jgi:hypothetical protein
MPLITDPARLKAAARACMRQRSAPGTDGVTWKDYRTGLDTRIAELAARLHTGTWRPAPVRLVTPPGWDKRLPIAIPTIEDRIVHRALRRAAEPVLDQDAYPPWMYGWRPRAGHLHAVAAAARHITAGRTWVADLDVAAVTAGATLTDTLGQLARWVHDGTFLNLVAKILQGLPAPLTPGSGLSPMLTNLRLLPVDELLEATGLDLVRLTDNYTAFCTTRTGAETAATRITEALTARGMQSSPAKSKVWRPNPEDLYMAG